MEVSNRKYNNCFVAAIVDNLDKFRRLSNDDYDTLSGIMCFKVSPVVTFLLICKRAIPQVYLNQH